jgi:hypothetical protein
MIILSSSATVEWVPPWLQGEAQPKRRYLFRAGSVGDRATVEAELAGDCRAAPVYGFEMSAAFADGVVALFPDNPDDASRLIELDQAEAALKEGESLPADEQALLDQAREIVGEAWPAYRALSARKARRNEWAPLVAFRRLCAGWEGEELPPFAKGLDGLVTAEAMLALPSLELRIGGAEAYRRLHGRGGDTEKNCEGPLPSGKGPRTSTSPAQKKGGGSPGKSGRRTRSSSSRPGRSKPSTSGSTAAG